jgi:hypothetical protein
MFRAADRWFAVELAFRVPNHFRKDSTEAITDIVDVLKFGILKRDASPVLLMHRLSSSTRD